MVRTLEVDQVSSRFRTPGCSLRGHPTGIPLDGLLRELEASWQRGGPGWDRRGEHRHDFCQTVRLIPLNDRTEEPEGSPMMVETTEISASGIGIFHSQPLPYRKVALTLTLPGGLSVTAITKLLWCRFSRQGGYGSGGQFLRWVESPH